MCMYYGMNQHHLAPSRFPRLLMSYVQYANDLGNPLGGVDSFHIIIHIAYWNTFSHSHFWSICIMWKKTDTT